MTSTEKALMGMGAKHFVSVNRIVRDTEKGEAASKAVWDEKIGDAINYLILLDLIHNERIEHYNSEEGPKA